MSSELQRNWVLLLRVQREHFWWALDALHKMLLNSLHLHRQHCWLWIRNILDSFSFHCQTLSFRFLMPILYKWWKCMRRSLIRSLYRFSSLHPWMRIADVQRCKRETAFLIMREVNSWSDHSWFLLSGTYWLQTRWGDWNFWTLVMHSTKSL